MFLIDNSIAFSSILMRHQGHQKFWFMLSENLSASKEHANHLEFDNPISVTQDAKQ